MFAVEEIFDPLVEGAQQLAQIDPVEVFGIELLAAIARRSSSMSGINSRKVNLRRKAVSSSAIERSAVFIVPMMCRFAGTPKLVPE